MGEVNQVVDHLKLEYKGVFSARDMFAMFTRWYKESPYEKGGDYMSEQHTSHGKCLEYWNYPWKKQTDSIRHFMKIRLLIYDLKKVDVMVDTAPKKIGAENREKLYEPNKVKAIYQGGEKHKVSDDASFVAQCNYDECVGKDHIRVVSCNTTGLSRTVKG